MTTANIPADTESRTAVLGAIRSALGRGPRPAPGEVPAPVARHLADHPRNLVPARSALPRTEQIALFVTMAAKSAATLTSLPARDAVPAEVARYLHDHGLPPVLRLAPTPTIESLPWSEQPDLVVSAGLARGDDGVGVTDAVAGIAETGTLMLISGPTRPAALAFLPDTHIVVLDRGAVVGSVEDAWDRLRAILPTRPDGGTAWPRTVNLITGPSRTGDIEQQIQMGAHGPRRLHIILVET